MYPLSSLITSDNQAFHFKAAYKLLQAQTFLKICFRNQPQLWFVNYKFSWFSLFILGKDLGNLFDIAPCLLRLALCKHTLIRPVTTSICNDFIQTEKTKNRSRRHKEAIQSSHATGQWEYWSEDLFIPSQCSLFQVSVTWKSQRRQHKHSKHHNPADNNVLRFVF